MTNAPDDLTICRTTQEESAETIWELCRELLDDGTTYIFLPDTPRAELIDYWFPNPGETYLAKIDGEAVGCYLLKPVHGGRGSHVANASYFVGGAARRLGVGRALAEHSIETARRAGFEAMQFNLVVATNRGAIALWEDLGFRTIGTIPRAFDHSEMGLTDALIMHRFL